MTAILCGVVAAVFTIMGGIFALRHADRLHLILSFSAGAVIGVAFFHLLPEALELSVAHYEVATLTAFVALGFGFYMVISQWLLLSSAHEEQCENPGHRGQLGAGTLSIHSFMDGAAIGVGFQASTGLGIAVAVAVITHDFSDGINTAAQILRNNGGRRLVMRWLSIDAAAPVAGVLSTSFFTIPEQYLAPLLAAFCGFFLYIGASDLLPEAHHGHPKLATVLTTLGALVIFYIASRVAHI